MGFILKSVFVCAFCMFLMQGYAFEFNVQSLYETLIDAKIENKLLPLKLKLEEATKKIEKQAEIINKLEEETTDKIEKQADRIRNLEESASKIEKIIKLEKETADKMEKQADRITKLEEATSKIEMQADRITNLEDATSKIEKQADKITKLEEETSDKMEKQADRITNLEEATSKVEKQARKITKLEEETEKNVKKIENMTMGGASIENAIQSLNNQMAQLENNTMNNEKAISNVTLMAKESSVKIAQDVAKKQSVVVRKMLYAVKQSFHDKFITFKNETKLQLSAMNTLNDNSKDMNEPFSNLNQEMQIVGDENVRKLESLRGEVSDQYKTTSNEANGDIQELQKRMVKVEERQGKRTAFLAGRATRQSNGTVQFSTVHLNEGSAYDSSSGIFTCQTTGLYHVSANMIEGGAGYNRLDCVIRKNNSGYVDMYYWQGKINDKRATDGYGHATGSGTFHLLKGDRVYVYCNSDTGSGLTHSSFSGFLISADP